MTSPYHSILTPLSDVYELGGPEVFKHLQGKGNNKNLVLITAEIAKQLNSSSSLMFGGKAALSYLTEQINTEVSKDYVLHHISPNLDVGYCTDDSLDSHSPANKKPTIITTDDEQKLHYKSQGFPVEPPEFLLIDKSIVNEGMIFGNDPLLEQLYSKPVITKEEAENILGRPLFLNQFVSFINPKNKSHIYSRVTGDLQKHDSRITAVKNSRLELLTPNSKGYEYNGRFFNNIFGIKPLNTEQFLAVQYGLLNPDVEVSFICGSQGSGKTILAYTSAVSLICDYISKGSSNPSPANFDQIVLFKPNDVMGGKKREVGFLPGNLWEKLEEDLQPFEDAHNRSSLNTFNFSDMVLHPKRTNKYGPKREFSGIIEGHWRLPIDREAFRVLSSGKSRGVSLERTIMVIDESQNFTPYEMRTLLGRLGVGSKAIILGDPDQFDNPLCSRDLNGLTAAVHHFMEKPYSFLINLNRNFRSQASNDTLTWTVFSQ